MNAFTRDQQAASVKRYDELAARAAQIHALIKEIEADDPTGPCKESPFTGNTRESRKVLGLSIQFSATLGRSPPVNKELGHLNISASKFADFIIGDLTAQLKAIQEEMEKL